MLHFLPKMKANLTRIAMLFLVTLMMLPGAKSWGQTTIFSENMGSVTATTTIAANTFQNSSLTFTGTADVRNTTPSTGYTGSSGNGNIFITNTSGINFQIAGVNTSNYTSLALSFGEFKSTTAGNNELVVEVSSDGTNYTALTYSRTTGSGTANWILVSPTGSIPSTGNLRIRFRQTSTTTQWRIDDVKLTGTPTYTITSSAGSNGTISPNGTTTVTSGGSQAYTITPAANYHIADVLVDGVSNASAVTNGSFTFSNVTATHTISASFAINTYSITASAGANGSISPAGATSVNYGGSQAYTITPDAGYHIADVLVDGASVGAVSDYTFNNVTEAHSIAASFEIDVVSSFDIVASAGANGSISPAGTTTLNAGGSQAYSFTPNACYAVADVLIDGISVGAVNEYTFTNVNAAHTISVSFVSTATTTDINETACDTYTWALNGTTYDASGDYTYIDGCNTTVLHLTINHSTTSEETAVACDSYEWHGTTYTESGDYTFESINESGCTNVATLHLTVNYSTTSEETAVACDSYEWHGTTYT
ncbi:autotransporter outer membrane beta-barrel domain-containing protein, partial [Limnovirga soli]